MTQPARTTWWLGPRERWMIPGRAAAAAIIAMSFVAVAGYADASHTVPSECWNRDVTIAGTDGDDDLNGTEVSDVMALGSSTANGFDAANGQEAGDRICGNGERDDLDGKQGPDFIDGGNDADIIAGGADSDSVLGGDGQDYIEGSGSGDDLSGENNNDTVIGNEGNDTLLGGPGDDTVMDGPGVDDAHGDAGSSDVLLHCYDPDWNSDTYEGFEYVYLNGSYC